MAFFADSGLTKPGGAAAIAKEPQLLCSNVEKTLKARLAQLRDTGLSPPQISGLIAITPHVFRSKSMVRRLPFYLSFLGSYDEVHSALRSSPFLLARDLECVVKPNMAFLLQCGLTHSDIAKFIFFDRIEAGASQGNSGMFKHALSAISDISPERIDAKLDFLKKLLGCSDNELALQSAS
ncbi:unnamed protein product [Miscanthus lutarioriparius]|uniref:Uncharacterized protein n=1 Tax=Miscanthus lutarioriparius TaxID=422564 RepID=A0A811SD90_9POAL|nr:unnamed protein product [Miscanthus lutarioriparius]